MSAILPLSSARRAVLSGASELLGPPSSSLPFADLSLVSWARSCFGSNGFSSFRTSGLFLGARPPRQCLSGHSCNWVRVSLWQVGGYPDHAWHLVLVGDRERHLCLGVPCQLLVLPHVVEPSFQFSMALNDFCCLLMHEGSSRSHFGNLHLS